MERLGEIRTETRNAAPSEKGRILYLDVARTLAILLVILNHAVNRTWSNYSGVQNEFYAIGHTLTLIKAYLTVASRYGVPLFLMITGALILNRRFEKKEDYLRFYRNNWWSLFVTSEIWFFLGFWFNVLVKPHPPLASASVLGKLRACVKTLLFIDQVRFDCMWYLPMILSIYLLLPVIAAFLQHSPARKVLLLPLAAAFVCSMFVPMVNAYMPLLGKDAFELYLYDMNFPSPYLLYVFAGWWISNGGMKKLSDRTVILLALLSYFACGGIQYFCYATTAHLLSYMSPGILFSSVFVFEAIRRYADKLAGMKNLFAAVSRSAFAIYLIHIYFNMGFHWYMSFEGWGRLSKVIFLEFVPLLGSGLVIAILSRSKFCRKYLLLMK